MHGHLADLQKTLPTTDLNKKKESPHDFYLCILSLDLITFGHGLLISSFW